MAVLGSSSRKSPMSDVKSMFQLMKNVPGCGVGPLLHDAQAQPGRAYLFPCLSGTFGHLSFKGSEKLRGFRWGLCLICCYE
jgi:hypothetical protein